MLKGSKILPCSHVKKLFTPALQEAVKPAKTL